MENLTRASQELFCRAADEQFDTLAALSAHCQRQKKQSSDRWHMPHLVRVEPDGARLRLALGSDGAFALNDWGFSQLCKLAGVGKDTVNRLSADSAARVLGETLRVGNKPLQVLTLDDRWIESRCLPYHEQVETRGQRSIPPGVYFRMLLVGYFEGIDSQRGIAWRCADSFAPGEHATV